MEGINSQRVWLLFILARLKFFFQYKFSYPLLVLFTQPVDKLARGFLLVVLSILYLGFDKCFPCVAFYVQIIS